jgi:hypothetical protein
VPTDSLRGIRSELQERLEAVQQEEVRLRAALHALNGGSPAGPTRTSSNGHSSRTRPATAADADVTSTPTRARRQPSPAAAKRADTRKPRRARRQPRSSAAKRASASELASTTQPEMARTSAPTNSHRPKSRTPRGAHRETVLNAAHARPGSTAAELRVTTGLASSVISRVVRALVASGKLREHKLEEWDTTYTATSTA